MFGLISVVISSIAVYRFWDIKKIIAFSSILHLNIVFIGILSFLIGGIMAGIVTSFTHGIVASLLFYVFGYIISMCYSRLSFIVLSFGRWLLILIVILSNTSFPGSFSFIAELLSLISICGISYVILVIILVSLLLAVYYWFIQINLSKFSIIFFSFNFLVRSLIVFINL